MPETTFSLSWVVVPAYAAAISPAAGLRCLKKSYRMKKTLSPGIPDIVSSAGICITCCKTGEIHAVQQRGAVGINPHRAAARHSYVGNLQARWRDWRAARRGL
ncbi:hypothetical protein [Paraburkholderia sp. JHI2823]|uniref:hypothetical protein n=1 Tax=Paraburkholderia sp. JHI2823 TaxID=3112960 RepID=UPI0012DE1D0D